MLLGYVYRQEKAHGSEAQRLAQLTQVCEPHVAVTKYSSLDIGAWAGAQALNPGEGWFGFCSVDVP